MSAPVTEAVHTRVRGILEVRRSERAGDPLDVGSVGALVTDVHQGAQEHCFGVGGRVVAGLDRCVEVLYGCEVRACLRCRVVAGCGDCA